MNNEVEFMSEEFLLSELEAINIQNTDKPIAVRSNSSPLDSPPSSSEKALKDKLSPKATDDPDKIFYAEVAMDSYMARGGCSREIEPAEYINSMHAVSALQTDKGLKAVLAAQLAGVHKLQQELCNTLGREEYPTSVISNLVNAVTKLTNASTKLASAIQSINGTKTQTIRVENVVIKDGGQAIVGNINSDR